MDSNSFRLRDVFLVLAVLCFHLDFYSAVKISIDPQKVKAERDPEVKVTCSLDEKDTSDAVEMLWMKINRKGGRPLVVLHSNGTVTYKEVTEEEVVVTGKIESGADLGKSVLEMIIKDPDTEDTGMYICDVSYNVTSGVTQRVKASATLTVKAGDVNEMDDKVQELLEQVKKEETALKELENEGKKMTKLVPELEEKSKNTEKKIKEMAEKEEKFQSKVSAIEDKAAKQLSKLEELSKKEETEVKSLKKEVEKLMNKRKKDTDDMNEISAKEDESKKKVKVLEEDVEKKEKEIEELEEKEKKVEKKVNDLEVKTKSAVKKIKDFLSNKMFKKDKLNKVEEKLSEKLNDLDDLKQKESEMEMKMKELENRMEKAIKEYQDLKNGKGFGSDSSTESGTGTGSTDTDTDIDTDPDYSTGGRGSSGGGGGDYDILSAFSATSQEKYIRPRKNNNLVLPDIVMQAGLEGYDGKTGVFTIPADGLYHFSLSIKMNCVKCYVTIAIMADNRAIARLLTGTRYDEGHNSVSTVVQLNKGSEVQLVNQDVNPAGTFLTAMRNCMFSGYLVAPLA